MSKLFKALDAIRKREKYQLSGIFITMKNEKSIRTEFNKLKKKSDTLNSVLLSYEYKLYREFVELDKIREEKFRLEDHHPGEDDD